MSSAAAVARKRAQYVRAASPEQRRIEERLHFQVDCRVIQAYADELDTCLGASMTRTTPELEAFILNLVAMLRTKAHSLNMSIRNHSKKFDA